MTDRPMQTVSKEDLSDAAFNVGSEADGVTLRDDYSGRFMYGEKCVAIIAPNLSIVSRILVNLASYDQDMAQMLSERERVDDMGRGVVAYFPGVTFA